MADFLRRFRLAVARTQGRSWALPEMRALRVEAIHYARTRRQGGASRRTIAEELGVSLVTVRRYLGERSAGSSGELRAVVVTPSTHASHGAVVVTPNGFRIEDLSVEDVVAIVRALS